MDDAAGLNLGIQNGTDPILGVGRGNAAAIGDLGLADLAPSRDVHRIVERRLVCRAADVRLSAENRESGQERTVFGGQAAAVGDRDPPCAAAVVDDEAAVFFGGVAAGEVDVFGDAAPCDGDVRAIGDAGVYDQAVFDDRRGRAAALETQSIDDRAGAGRHCAAVQNGYAGEVHNGIKIERGPAGNNDAGRIFRKERRAADDLDFAALGVDSAGRGVAVRERILAERGERRAVDFDHRTGGEIGPFAVHVHELRTGRRRFCLFDREGKRAAHEGNGIGEVADADGGATHFQRIDTELDVALESLCAGRKLVGSGGLDGIRQRVGRCAGDIGECGELGIDGSHVLRIEGDRAVDRDRGLEGGFPDDRCIGVDRDRLAVPLGE